MSFLFNRHTKSIVDYVQMVKRINVWAEVYIDGFREDDGLLDSWIDYSNGKINALLLYREYKKSLNKVEAIVIQAETLKRVLKEVLI